MAGKHPKRKILMEVRCRPPSIVFRWTTIEFPCFFAIAFRKQETIGFLGVSVETVGKQSYKSRFLFPCTKGKETGNELNSKEDDTAADYRRSEGNRCRGPD